MASIQKIIGKIEILPDGQIQIREDTIVYDDDGNELTRLFHRRVAVPGDDTSKEIDSRIDSVAQVLWTPEVVKAYKETQAATAATADAGDVTVIPLPPTRS